MRVYRGLSDSDLLSQVPYDHIQHFKVRLRQFVDQFVHLIDALIKTFFFCGRQRQIVVEISSDIKCKYFTNVNARMFIFSVHNN